ncbi:MDR family MFS transporter [Microbacterium suaedae]|uniref:MDR family MFS transporter n=1 Tax=Microbacterium suaedae TaxID=2067813 RepID=UPI001E64302C|nr:MDR family MFS transporter [Microbacterium suaedae]
MSSPHSTTVSARMSRRQVLEALSGLLLAMFCSMMSMTVVGTSLPIIVPELGGSQTSYTWVVTMTLLTTAISTPIWGKLADLLNRKTLMLIALTVFVLASAGAGLSQNVEMLIFFRALQGIGGGGLQSMAQILMADIISPRERGRYMGLMAGVMAIGTVGGPLLGGLLTDTIGWRWNFYVGVPLGIIAFIVITRTLHISQHRAGKVRIDYLGIGLLSVAAGFLLVWISNVSDYGWASWETLYMVGIGVVATIAFILVERRSAEPLIPMQMFRDRTFTLAVLASVSIGVSMFGTAIYLSQYLQIARGFGPTEAGLLTIPMAAGMLGASTVIGQIVSRTGIWKPYLILGGTLLVAGTGLLSTLQVDTPLWLVGVFMFLLGSGTGMTMQNLVLVVQNSADPTRMGVASSGVNFFRSVGGTAGVAIMGSVLAASMTQQVTDRMSEIGAAVASLGAEGRAVAEQLAAGTLPTTRDMPETIAVIIEDIAANAISHAFLVGVPLAILSLVAICFLPKARLVTQTTIERLEDRKSAEASTTQVGAERATQTAVASTGAIPTHTPEGSETPRDDD